MAAELTVWLESKLVGDIRRAGLGHIEFQYASEWLNAPHAFPISLSLPFRHQAFDKNISTSFFDNLLPEENVRKLVADKERLPPDDVFGLLRAFGADCAGALSVLSTGKTPQSQECRYKSLSTSELSEFLDEQVINPLGGGEKGGRLSLAGAQSKTSLLLSADIPPKYSRPLYGAPSTHIVKPASPLFPYLAENEVFCTLLATALGLDTQEVSLTPTLKRAFVIRRYDRELTPDGSIRRLHQEDFCQALGIPRTQKYQSSKGGPSYAKCFALLAHCHASENGRLKLFQWVVFNYLTGNADAHGKNISLLYDNPPKPRLAPFYDLVCTAVYPGISKNMAMKIGRKNNPDHIHWSDWLALQKAADIPQDDARQIMDGMCSALDSVLDAVINSFIELYGQEQLTLLANIAKVIRERVRHVRAALGEALV